MTENYFSKFPSINYGNTVCKDLTRRVKIDETMSRNINMFYPYIVKNESRADQLAQGYYQDSSYDWLIYLENEIIDPYYGWSISEADFNSLLKTKYGSIETSYKKIMYYQVNLATDESEISISYYNTNLPGTLKRYYTPNYIDELRVLSYKKNNMIDWTSNTNKIVKFDYTLTGNNAFVKGEFVDFKNTLNVTTGYSGGEVISTNSTSVFIKNISGNTDIGNYIVGETSRANGTIVDTTTIQQNISDAEAVYWAPVYAYEFEREKNESRKNIRLINANYALDVAEKLRVKLKE